MKRVLLFMAALCVSLLTFAQVQVATLQHGDSVRAFYNRDAFVEAYNAATTGDVISLSAGNFTSCDINKDSLTIRGAGSHYTKFDGSCNLGNDTANLNMLHTITMEGIDMRLCYHVSPYSRFYSLYQYGHLDAHFLDIRFNNYQVYGSGASVTGQFVNCYFTSYYPLSSSSNPTLINCLVYRLSRCSASTFINCFVRYPYASSSAATILQSEHFLNSILYLNNDSGSSVGNIHYELPSTVFAQNCLGLGHSTMFSLCTSLNCTVAGTNIVNNMDTNAQYPYSLIDSLQTVYIGTDGTQIGLYGGPCPYSRSSLTYPIISRMNVAPRTTADGRLSVDIEVGYRQETEESNE